MIFRVEVTAEAERDADAILEWLLSQHAGETGMRWFILLENAIASLAKFPERCALAPESKAFPFEVRHLLYGHKPHVYPHSFYDRSRYRANSPHSSRPPASGFSLTSTLF
jgi:plasmid stabilization system protein ParE